MSSVCNFLNETNNIFSRCYDGFQIAKQNKQDLTKLAEVTIAVAVAAGLFVAIIGASTMATVVIAGVVGIAVFAKMCYDFGGRLNLNLQDLQFKLPEITIKWPVMKLDLPESPPLSPSKDILDMMLEMRKRQSVEFPNPATFYESHQKKTDDMLKKMSEAQERLDAMKPYWEVYDEIDPNTQAVTKVMKLTYPK